MGMKARYCLGRLGNEQLLAALQALVGEENELTSDLLAHLAELDERKLYLELGFSSLFAYCTELLGLSESSAGRRITAARVARRFPDVFAAVARGELNLSILCALNPYLNHENAAQLFAACGGKKRQQVEEILAARFPKPDVRESIRRLPVRLGADAAPVTVMANAVLDSAERPSALDSGALETGESLPSFQASTQATTLARPSPPSKANARVEPLSVDRYGVHFTADGEFRDLLDAARALASHRLPAGNIAELMKLALKAFIQDAEKRRFAVGRKPRRSRARVEGPAAETPLHSPGESDAVAPTSQVDLTLSGPPDASRMSRHVPAAVAREVYVRDEGRCSFVSADGRRCNCRVFLELDHAEPWAVGGAPTPVNLRLRCRAHNLLHARRYYGKVYVAAAIARRRDQMSECALTHRG